MDSSMLKGILVGGAAAATFAAVGVGGYKVLSKPTHADVIAVKEIKETVRTPREECTEVQVRQQAPVQDQHRVAGTVAGGVLGGVLGSMVGGGTGKTLATVGGAAAGAYAGNTVQGNMQKNDAHMVTQTRCKTVNVMVEKLVGYDVTYKIGDKQDLVRMDHKPGEKIPLKDGQLVLRAPG